MIFWFLWGRCVRERSSRCKAIDLFSGCGGLSIGLTDAGFDVVAAVENEPLACSTYRLNHPRPMLIEKDIERVRPSALMRQLGMKFGDLDLLAGCPPCQGFSTLRTLNGKKAITDQNNDLIFQFTKFVRTFGPKSIMMENVPGLIDDLRLDKFQTDISRLGYSSEARVLDAVDFGAPQKRKRMVLVAVLEGEPSFAKPVRYKKSVRWALSKLSEQRAANDPAHNYKVRRASHVNSFIKKIPKNGGSRNDLPLSEQLDCHQRCDGFKDVYGRMNWTSPAPTITGGCINPSKGRFLHPDEDRAITLREAALLQGFPVGYKFDMTRGRYPVAQLIGNAFPPQFAYAHAKLLISQIGIVKHA